MVFYAMVLGVVITGGRYTLPVLGWSVKNPDSRLLIGTVFLLLWFILAKVRHWDRRARWAALGKSILLCFSLGITLVIAEITTRAFLQQKVGNFSLEQLSEFQEDSDIVRPTTAHPLAVIIKLIEHPQLVYELQPNISMDFGHTELVTNGDGLRSRSDYAIEKPENTLRIVGLGDSGIFGWGVEQDEPFPAVLEKNLNARNDGTHYEVLNLGVPAYNTWQEVEMLKYKGLKYKPDIVVLHWCFNDFEPPFWQYQPAKIDRRDLSYFYYLTFKRRELMAMLEPKVIDYKNRDELEESSAPMIPFGPEGSAAAFQELKRLAEQHGFKVLIFGPIGSHASPTVRSSGLPDYNTYAHIPKTEETQAWAVHEFHPRGPGHALLAEKLEETLRERGWIPE